MVKHVTTISQIDLTTRLTDEGLDPDLILPQDARDNPNRGWFEGVDIERQPNGQGTRVIVTGVYCTMPFRISQDPDGLHDETRRYDSEPQRTPIEYETII